MLLKFSHPTTIHVLRACPHEQAIDLVAFGGENSVQVVQITEKSCTSLATFQIGSRITALAWSSRSRSPSTAGEDAWFIELAAATIDRTLHLLTKAPSDSDVHNYGSIFNFGGGLTGHHAKINDMSFCGGNGPDSEKYLATVSDDKMLMVWDLYPSSPSRSPSLSPFEDSPEPRSPPTAYVIPFSHPLVSISSHPSSAKEFLVTDSRGSVFITDWRSDPSNPEFNPSTPNGAYRHSSLLELLEPHSMASPNGQWSASADWRRDTTDIIGAVHRNTFSIWDISNLRGGKPNTSGPSFPEGGGKFRWCPSHPSYFAISSLSPRKGAIVHIHNTSYVHAQPKSFCVLPKPHFIRDMDWVGTQEKGLPRLVVAIEKMLWCFPVNVEL